MCVVKKKWGRNVSSVNHVKAPVCLTEWNSKCVQKDNNKFIVQSQVNNFNTRTWTLSCLLLWKGNLGWHTKFSLNAQRAALRGVSLTWGFSLMHSPGETVKRSVSPRTLYVPVVIVGNQLSVWQRRIHLQSDDVMGDWDLNWKFLTDVDCNWQGSV